MVLERIKVDIMRVLPMQAFVAIQRIAARHANQVAITVREAGLTPAQYNVLCILRDAGPNGLGCNAVADLMITRDPDMTRLLDKLEARELVTRARSQTDRRVVTVRITAAGSAALEQLDEPIALTHEDQFHRLDEAGLRKLIELLEAIP